MSATSVSSDRTMDEVPAPKKRSLFTKATLSKSAEAEDSVAFFSRAKELQAQRLAEDERRRQKKIAKLERKRSSASVETKETTPDGKRRRTSTQPESKDAHSPESAATKDLIFNRRETSPFTPDSDISKQLSPQTQILNSPTTLSGRYSESLRTLRQGAIKSIITIGDSDSEDGLQSLPARRPNAKPIILGEDDDEEYRAPRMVVPQRQEDDLDLSDEEFPELVQKARERVRQREYQRLQAAKSFNKQNHSSGSPIAETDDDDIFQLEPKVTNLDPSIEILITSVIEGAKPLMVKRKLSQKLQAVRYAWCDKQSLAELSAVELKQEIFLTWRCKRLFDATSCQALGLRIDGSGQLSSDGEGIDNGKVHLEAWTEKTFAAFKNEEKARLRKEDSCSDGESAVAQEEEIVKIRLIMKAKDLEDVKIIVKPSTMIRRLITIFRQSRQLPEENEVTLFFDGEKLDPESTIEDAELDDMDSIEVHVR